MIKALFLEFKEFNKANTPPYNLINVECLSKPLEIHI